MLNVIAIPAFTDNYIWMLKNKSNKNVLLVDPGDEKTIIYYLQQQALQPTVILITHQHYDHTGGIKKIVELYPDVKIYCPDSVVSKPALSIDLPIAEYVTHPLKDGDKIVIEEFDVNFEVLAIPGHTLDHIAYYGEGLVFCGDTIFGCGCGRLFSGSAEQMSASLQRLANLPIDTRVFSAHEYTVDSIGFAKWVEPDNKDLVLRYEIDFAKQEKGIPTMPSTIEIELKTNPFMRCHIAQVKQAAEKFSARELTTNAEVFASIRQWKDSKYD